MGSSEVRILRADFMRAYPVRTSRRLSLCSLICISKVNRRPRSASSTLGVEGAFRFNNLTQRLEGHGVVCLFY